MLQVVVGLVVVAAAARCSCAAGSRAGRPRGGRRTAAGLASGAMTTSISVSGPPLVLWLERAAWRRPSCGRRWRLLPGAQPRRLRPAGAAGRDRRACAAPACCCRCSALVLAGYAVGAAAFRRLDPDRFSLGVLGLVVRTGVASLVAGLTAA